MNSSRDVTPRESDADFASETEAADFSPEELIWGVTWLCEWDWLAELEVERLVEREVDSEESWLAFNETSVLAGSWRLAEADPYTTVDSFTAFEAKAEADDQFDACDIEWVDEVDLFVEVEDWSEALVWCDAEANSEVCLFEADSDGLAKTDAEFKTDFDALADAETDAEVNLDTEADWSSEDSIWATDSDMLVETDSEIEADANSEACLFEADSEALIETDSKLKIDSEALADAETDAEVNSDTEADWS